MHPTSKPTSENRTSLSAMKTLFPLVLLMGVAYAAPSASAPATLSKEGDLMTIVLKPEAEERLRLKTVAVERRSVSASRLFSGEVLRPLAAEGKLTAPLLGGTLDEVLKVADAQASADGRVLQAQAQVESAKIAVNRAEKVLSADAGSVRSVDEAKATLTLAEAALRTAKAQRELLGAAVGGPVSNKGAWVRVAIYSGESGALDAKATATIRSIVATSGGQSAKPVAGPQTANAATMTVDWYYELPTEYPARLGERVAVEIPVLDAKVEKLVVPFAAILHDYHGGQWVYEVISPHTYARRRVQVGRISGGDAVLVTGPKPGTQIVTDGSAELFGTEFVTGK